MISQSCLDQLNKWVEGISEHNTEMDECCPDFSCCHPEAFVQDKVARIAFRDAYLEGNVELQEKMLMMFLAGSIPKMTNKKIYIAGDADIHEV
jgi:hypothetical protein